MPRCRLALLIVAIPVLFAAGFLPGVTWLPDSSGFFFTDGEDFEQLVFFDKATATTRVLNKNTGAPTYWPAVSPDGKTITVAHHTWEFDKPDTLEIFFDRLGKEFKRTRPFLDAPDKSRFFKNSGSKSPCFLRVVSPKTTFVGRVFLGSRCLETVYSLMLIPA